MKKPLKMLPHNFLTPERESMRANFAFLELRLLFSVVRFDRCMKPIQKYGRKSINRKSEMSLFSLA